MRALLVVSLIAFWNVGASAQKPGIDANDPQLLQIYLRQVHRAVQGPDNAKAGIAESLKISVGQLPQLDALYAELSQRMDLHDQSYRAQALAQKTPIDASSPLEKEYRARQMQIVQDVKTRMHLALGDVEWNQFQLFLEGEFRLRIGRRKVQ